MNKKIQAEFIVDSVKSWFINGSELTSATDADLYTLERTANVSKLRGNLAIGVKVNKTKVPAVLRLNVGKKNADKFANIYKTVGGNYVFCSSVKIKSDGIVDFNGADAAGEYIVMACEFSDLLGDINNDGVMNALDASEILKYSVGLAEAVNLEIADVNGDGVINALDASAILKSITSA